MLLTAVWLAGIYYSNKIVGFLAGTFFSTIVLEGRLAVVENESHERNYRLGFNPLQEEYLLNKQLKLLRFMGLSEEQALLHVQENPRGMKFEHIILRKENLSPSHKHLAGKWLLTEAEAAQFKDMLTRDNLDSEIKEGANFAEICKTHEVEPIQMALLSWPFSDSTNVDHGWLKSISDARLSDPEFLARFERR
jgi:hypothetical protein